MNVLHLLVSGGTGGIEVLMKNYAQDSTHRNIFIFVWKSGEIAELMEHNGIPVYVTDVKKDGTIATLDKIHQICSQEQVDVVVSHNSAPLLKLALIYIKMRNPGVKTVAYAHANARDICEHRRKKGLFLRKLVHRMGFAAADGIVAISDSVQESLRSFLNVKDKKIRRIYNGTRIGVPADSCRKNRQQHSLRLIFVGRLIPEKGVQNTLRILAELKKEVPFVFSVVGEGPYRNDLELQSETLGLKEQVRFLGRRDDISELLAESDVFIHLPEWEEGFGITVIEALAEGCICLINNRGALPEIVEHEKSGYIVPAASTEAVVAMLRRLWEMPDEEWNRMSTNARQRVQLFSMERFAENLDGFLSEVCRS